MRACLGTFTTIAVLLGVSGVGLAQGVDVPSTDLPPPGVYVAPDEYHSYSAMGIVLDDPVHTPLLGTVIRQQVGDDEIESFDSEFTATEIGIGLGPLLMTGPTTVRVEGWYTGGQTGTFQTEIISMNLAGIGPWGPMIIRESPTLPSQGLTEITDIGGGMYHIDSFFDVFTELSVDGGMSWVPCDASTHMYLIPEPAMLLLLALGGLMLTRRRR